MDGLKYYTPDEVAEILKVSRRTVYNYIRDGKLEVIKIGRNIRIAETTIKSFLGGN